MALEFDWDFNKDEHNFGKHGIAFNEAATIFVDPLSVTFPDPDHSFNEERFITIGLSNKGRTLIVAHLDKGDKIRIISAGKTTRHERRFYEEGQI
jgi:uncharacterized DUF497 family protein